MQLDGRRAVVTGAAGGIATAIWSVDGGKTKR